MSPTAPPTRASATSGVVPTAPPTPSAGGSEQYQELLSHIPAAISGTCTEADPAAAGALAIARCQPEELTGAGGEVTYTQYETSDPLFDLLETTLEAVGDVPPSDDPQACAAGPVLTAYYAGGISEGRLICAPDVRSAGAVFAWWADLRFNVIGSALVLEGSYPVLYDVVQATVLEV